MFIGWHGKGRIGLFFVKDRQGGLSLIFSIILIKYIFSRSCFLGWWWVIFFSFFSPFEGGWEECLFGGRFWGAFSWMAWERGREGQPRPSKIC